MKHLLILCLLIAGTFGLRAQDTTAPAKTQWQYSVEKKGPQEFVLHLDGTITPGSKLFSTTATDDEPNTRVTVDSSATITNITEQGDLHKENDTSLGMDVKYLTDKVSLLVTVKLAEGAKKLEGTITMTLLGKDGVEQEETKFKYNVDASGNLVNVAAGLQEASADAKNSLKRSNVDIKNPVSTCGGTGSEEKKSLWGIFLLGVIGGFLGLLTPCVFPMIPLTVSFFTKKSVNKKTGVFRAVTYGFFIFLIYILLSVPFHFIGLQGDVLNNISTNVWLNLFFFVILAVFAISFFGAFEITLPSSLSSMADEKANSIGGIIGIFFMALTLAIVSFSCTGPILGSLLAGAVSGGAWPLTAGMAGFGFALALPFAFFAFFPNMLTSLPKSGGWLTSVKFVLGLIELAMAFKFLSNADLVTHWGILKREVFFGIWVIIAVITTLYLLGILTFGQPKPKKLNALRIILAIVFGAIAVYLAPGVTNTKYAATRTLMSGFAPPLSYSIYGDDTAKKGVEADVMNDYEKALQLAKEQHKPVLIDFTGWACVNCRKMEENVWPQQEVRTIIKDNYILVSLYVDDRKLLPENEQFLYTTSTGLKKEIKTVGDKYATMQTENFVNNSQPFYVLISPDEKLLTRPVGYTPNAQEYAKWLQCGLDAYNKTK
jgi:thiol:disulfide interchange protein